MRRGSCLNKYELTQDIRKRNNLVECCHNLKKVLNPLPQIAVDLFVLNIQHVDLATLTGIAKFSGGQVRRGISFLGG